MWKNILVVSELSASIALPWHMGELFNNSEFARYLKFSLSTYWDDLIAKFSHAGLILLRYNLIVIGGSCEFHTRHQISSMHTSNCVFYRQCTKKHLGNCHSSWRLSIQFSEFLDCDASSPSLMQIGMNVDAFGFDYYYKFSGILLRFVCIYNADVYWL